MQFLSYFIWNADPELFSIGSFSLRWYGLLFAVGFIIGQQMLYYIHKQEGKPQRDVDTLTVWMVIATIVGARLGHVLFYEPQKYLADPIEIFMIRRGGLASHGAAIAILLIIWVYSRYEVKFKGIKLVKKKIKRENQSYFQVLDRLVILIALTAMLIRVGNFINSEIEGMPTGTESGVLFARTVTDRLANENEPIKEVIYSSVESDSIVDGKVPLKMILVFKQYTREQVEGFMRTDFKRKLSDRYIKKYVYDDPNKSLDYQLIDDNGTWTAIVNTQAVLRYPSQLYEAAGYFLVFVVLYIMWARTKLETPSGRLLGAFMIMLFGLRFLFEFIKEDQVAFEGGMPLNMGQLLSIPLVIAGIIIFARSFRKEKS